MQEIKKINLSLEFSTIALNDIVSLVIDYRGKTPKKLGSDWSENGIRALSAKNIKTGQIIREDAIRYVDMELYNKWMKDEIKRNDILITSEAPFGEVFFWDSDEKIVLSQRLFGVRCNENKVDPKFIYFYMASEMFQWELQSRATGTTVKGLRQPELLKCEIQLPNIANQRKISYILSNIESKINVLKELNKNLEQLIKYIYINWFEEFEPFKDKDFYDTKLGSIPVGWDVKLLQEFIKFQEGPGIRNWQYVEEDGINFLNIRCIQNNDLVLDTANMISKEEANGKYAHFMLNEWDLVISSSGTLGRYAIVREEHLPLCLNTSIIRFTPMHSFDHYAYVYSYLTSRGFYHYLLTMGSGSVQLNFGPTHLKQIDLIVPPENILKKYNDLIFPLIEQMVTIKSEISKLTKLRDTLLPKLMSGEIDVSKINCDLKIIIRKIYIKSSKLFLWRYLSENQNYIKNTKSNETLLKSRTIHKINKFFAKFNARYRYYRQQ